MNTAPPANRTRTIIPQMILDTIPNGRYACREDENDEYMFIRVSRPNKGQYQGCLKVQTQHGEDYKLALIVDVTGSLYWHNLLAEPALLMAALSPARQAREYALVIGRCCSCGKELTDPRSRWYGIGPECEKNNEEYMEWVTEQEGPYVP